MKYRYYLLDTNILGPLAEFKAAIKTDESAKIEKHMNALPENTRIFLCPISVGEVESGVRIDYKNSDKTKLAQEILSAFTCLPIDANLAREYYAKLRARLFNKYAPKDSDNRKKRRMEEWREPTTSKDLKIQENDLWLAAVAMAHNLILVTRDNMDAIREVAGSAIAFENWLE
ncbi:MAG: type II toxin-antitoxin system VapC family toxin [Nitrospirae bacterium]|nr:type II toxin-antitoxin system VapC family toxin [Nitrospirota bacterium]MCL5236688.1 type II toxin-antitoxin system VapC family toxin [Nitrospirota bacterium]